MILPDQSNTTKKGGQRAEGLSLVDFDLLRHAGLSATQILVVHYLQQGCTAEEISHVLGRSEHGVRYHVKSIGKKLNTRSRVTEVVAQAIITTYKIALKRGLKHLPLVWKSDSFQVERII